MSCMGITRAASTTTLGAGTSTAKHIRWCSNRRKRLGRMGIELIRFVEGKGIRG